MSLLSRVMNVREVTESPTTEARLNTGDVRLMRNHNNATPEKPLPFKCT